MQITNIRQWARETKKSIQGSGLNGVLDSLFYVYAGLWLTLSSRITIGHNIYDSEWDLLIILDACRTDAIEAVASEYQFLEQREKRWSVGSTSAEWLANTFTKQYQEEISETAYITGNLFSEIIFEERQLPPYSDESPPSGRTVPFAFPKWTTVHPDDFGQLEEIWKIEEAESNSAVLPRAITDAVISQGRAGDCERVIAHYMQPHEPYIGSDTHNSPGLLNDLSDDEIDKTALWDAYLENLRYVLDDVELLLENIDAEEVIITADHGEAFGEFGSTAHTICFPHPVVKRVPWIRTSATDGSTHEPGQWQEESNGFDRDQHLEDLGYL